MAKQTQVRADVRVATAETSVTNKGILASQRVTQDLVRSQGADLKRMANRLEIPPVAPTFPKAGKE